MEEDEEVGVELTRRRGCFSSVGDSIDGERRKGGCEEEERRKLIHRGQQTATLVTYTKDVHTQ